MKFIINYIKSIDADILPAVIGGVFGGMCGCVLFYVIMTLNR